MAALVNREAVRGLQPNVGRSGYVWKERGSVNYREAVTSVPNVFLIPLNVMFP